MARLTTAERDALPASDFAIPESRDYPIQNASHARDALARVAADGTPAEQARVRAAVAKRYPTMGKRKGRGKTNSKPSPRQRLAAAKAKG